ncbi:MULTISPECIES: biopolymer transporter ExbD [Trichocoleus]|uniref:Biopolymer transporter ExbD n=1 Tax=Trichocoleus desertorum GB2-A4 TaxID=2933944 RepID=A0ABV0J851_9CYAN|nr:biopolymer transporter ExbD [Trichocoleus sp. FACHB-46]MBD1863415.1 biopolymer transporter ExbD [Trichocoleus sp. FACHB-46]
MKINLESPGEEVQIQIIPLIDVIFCILTFFILAALQLTRQQAINVDLPQAGTAATQMRQMLVVSIDSVGQTYIDQNPVTEAVLYQQLLGYQQTNPDGMIVLYAPKTAIYDDVVRVLDLLRSVGGDRVALATLPGSPNPAGNQTNPANPTLPGVAPLPGGAPLPGASPYPLNLEPPGANPSPTFNPNVQLFPSPGQVPNGAGPNGAGPNGTGPNGTGANGAGPNSTGTLTQPIAPEAAPQ